MNNQLFGTNYLSIRNTNLIPLVSYGVKKSKLNYWLFKDVITTKPLSITKLTGKSTLEIELEPHIFYNALHTEVEMFFNKAIIQFSQSLNSYNGSPSWSFVTTYYFAFFCCTCFLRFLRQGFIYLNSAHKKNIENLYLLYNSLPISIATGTYYFTFKEINTSGNVVISLINKGDNFHKQNWENLHRIFQSFLPMCDADNFESSHDWTIYLYLTNQNSHPT